MTEQSPHPDPERPRFALGQVLATPGALTALEAAYETQSAPQSLRLYLARHVAGDWGEVDSEDAAANEWSIDHEARILSAYTLPTDERLWIITEADRSSTTALLPAEY